MDTNAWIEKEEFELARDIFYSLTSDDELTSHRNAKLIAMLSQHLVESGLVLKGDLDRLIAEALR